MTHDEVQGLLAAVPLDRMDASTRRAVDAHLDACAACREAADWDRFLEDGLEPLRTGGSLAPAVEARVAHAPSSGEWRTVPVGGHSVSSRRTSRRSTPKVAWGPMAAAACVGAAVVLGWMALTEKAPATTQNETNVPVDLDRPGAPPEIAKATEPRAPSTKIAVAKETPTSKKQGSEPRPEAANVAQEPGKAQDKAKPAERPFNPDEWVLMPLPDVEKESLVKAPEDPPGASDAALRKARLRPINSQWSGRDTLRLADGEVGLDLFESDLRVVVMGSPQRKDTQDLLAVAMGGRDTSRLVDLGPAGGAPETLEEKDALSLGADRRYLLKRLKDEGTTLYFVRVSAHLPGEYVDLEWQPLAAEVADALVVKAREAYQAALAKGQDPKRPAQGKAGVEAEAGGAGDLLARPAPELQERPEDKSEIIKVLPKIDKTK
ncbi:MAG: zf-HC2 domain-containing protein [Planctomycetes bacterium]|nr:zf-HC2 domain-containing protein [Planctomycetota bacterium]